MLGELYEALAPREEVDEGESGGGTTGSDWLARSLNVCFVSNMADVSMWRGGRVRGRRDE